MLGNGSTTTQVYSTISTKVLRNYPPAATNNYLNCQYLPSPITKSAELVILAIICRKGYSDIPECLANHTQLACLCRINPMHPQPYVVIILVLYS